jgi:hypothetical protein
VRQPVASSEQPQEGAAPPGALSMQQDMHGLGSASRRVGAQVTVVDRRALAPPLVQEAPIEASAAREPWMTLVLLEYGARGGETPQLTINVAAPRGPRLVPDA